MREYNEFKVFTTAQEINEIATVQRPSDHDIRLAKGNEGIVKGYTVAIFNNSINGFDLITRLESEAECIEEIRKRKEICNAFPEVFGNWYTECGDMYIFKTYGEFKPDWGVHAIVVEE